MPYDIDSIIDEMIEDVEKWKDGLITDQDFLGLSLEKLQTVVGGGLMDAWQERLKRTKRQ